MRAGSSETTRVHVAVLPMTLSSSKVSGVESVPQRNEKAYGSKYENLPFIF